MGVTKYDGASHFATQESFEVQRTNHFEISIDLASVLKDSGFANAQEHIRLATKECGVPKITIDPIELKHGNERIFVAASPKYESISITVYDTIGTDVQGILQEWYRKVFNPQTHQMGLVSQYKTTATLWMYSPDSTTIRSWTLYGVFPTSIGVDSNMSFDSADAVTITMELAVDKAVENLEATA